MSGIPGQQSIAYISQLGAGYAPIASGIRPSFASGFEGLPIPGGQEYGPFLQMALGPMFQGLMSRAGMTGMGLGHDQNVYDRIRAQQFQTQMQRQMQNTSELDRGNYVQTMQGISALFGVPFGGEQRVAANRLADLAVSMAPMLAVNNPDLLDKLSGSRGSAVVLGQRLAESGRYRLDPVTGRMGVDPETVQKLTKNIMENLYSPEKISEMKGITAGQLGGMYEQLSLRGMVAGSDYGFAGTMRNLQGAMPRQELLQKANELGIKGIKETGGKLDLSGLTAKDLDLLTKDDAVAQKLRDFDANRVKASLKSYVSAISAMRDIFGDAGQPNAPIPELMRALEGLSTGSMGQVDPQRLGQMVRQTYYLAKSGGISADAAGLMQQDAAARGQQLGIEAPFAMLATQNSLAYNTALRSRGVMANPVFGGMSEAQLTQMNTSLTQQGVASNFGTRLGTLLRMQDIVGADNAKNTNLGIVLEAVRSGKETVNIDGKQLTIANLSNQDIERLGASAGISKGQVQSMLGQSAAAREALFNNPSAVNYIREVSQPSELKQMFAGSTNVALQSFLRRDLNIKDKDVLSSMGKVSNDIIEQLLASPDVITANTETRAQAVAGMLQNMLPEDVKNKMFAGRTEEEQRASLRALASDISANLDVTAKRRTNAGNFANTRRLMDPSLLAEGSARQLTESLRNEAREALSGISSGSALRNAIDALKDVDINDKSAFEKVIGRTFGGVYDAKIGEALREPMNKLTTAQKELNDIERSIELEPDPYKRRTLIESHRAKTKQIEGLTAEVRKVGENVNAYSATGLTQSDITAAQQSEQDAQKVQRNIAVAKADDTRIDVKQREARKQKMQEEANAAGKNVTITDTQAEQAIIRERRATKPVTEAEIQNRMRSGNLSREAATEQLNAENIAKRLGITDEEIKAKSGSYVDAVNALAKERDDTRIDVKQREARKQKMQEEANASGKNVTITDTQAEQAIIAERRATKPVTEAEIQNRMRSKNLSREAATEQLNAENTAKRLGITDEEIKAKRGSYADAVYALAEEREIKDPEVKKERMAAFEKSRDAEKIRRAFRGVTADRENLIKRGLDPASIRAYGVGVAEQARELQTIQQKQQNLIDQYGGSETSFFANATAEQKKEFEALGRRGSDVQKKMAEMIKPDGPSEAQRADARKREVLRQFGVTSEEQLPADKKASYQQALNDLAISEKLKNEDIKTIDENYVRDKKGQLTDASRTKLEALAQEKKTDVDTLLRARQQLRSVEDRAKSDRELITATPEVLADRLKTSFGLDAKGVEAVQTSLGSYEGRQKAASLLRAQEGLKSLAGTGDIATIQKEYDEAIGAKDKEKAMAAFREKYKLTSQADFEKAEADLTTYKSFDVDKFKGEGGGKALAERLALLDDKTTKNANMPAELALSGKLTGEFTLAEPNKLISVGDASLNARSTATV